MKSMYVRTLMCDLNPGKIITFDNHGICKTLCRTFGELKPKEEIKRSNNGKYYKTSRREKL